MYASSPPLDFCFLLQHGFVLTEVTAFLTVEPHVLLSEKPYRLDLYVVVVAVPDLREAYGSR